MSQLIEATRLDDLGITVGFMHVPGAGFRVATFGGGDEHFRHLSIAATRRLAKALGDDPELVPVIRLLNAKADRLEGFLEGTREDAQLAEMALRLPPEGNA